MGHGDSRPSAIDSRPRPLTIDQRLSASLADRYRVERELGRGGMATVYLAEDLKHQRQVALKVLRPELAALLGPERFLNEIRITAGLDHPHIVTLLDSGASDGLLWYVLPYIRGESLRARLNREKQLDVTVALTIAQQIASALDFAHQRGVIHRDVKPENILLHEGEAMLADFGIALAVKEAGGNRLTETGLSLGTPQYMSPEQATGDRTLDARSDVYSLGAVLYEMLAGEPPVTGPTAQAMIAKLMTERPTRLRVVRDTVPEGIDNAVAKALAKVPADRFASAEEFARVLARPGGASSGKAGTGRRWITFAVVGAVMLGLGLAAWLGLHARPAAVPTFTPQFDQLTTDGNARSPALSPDGTRLAYAARDCDQQERCIDRLVVRDIGGVGSITVFKASKILFTNWAADGRFLIAGLVEPGGGWKTVAVSALGGTLWSLPGWGVGVVGVTDTLLVSPGLRGPGDSVSWLRLVTISDGLGRDSIAIRRPALFQIGIPSPIGGRIALVNATVGGSVIYLMDRSGTTTDSLPRLVTLRTARWAPRADALLLQVDLGAGNPQFGEPGGAPVPSVLIRHRVSPRGKFGPADTLLRLDAGSQINALRSDGSALLTRGPVEAVVYALERSGPGRLDFRSRRLASSTAGLQARLSRDGSTVWLKRGGSSTGSPRSDAFLSFEGGSERPFSLPPGDEISADWDRPVSTGLFYAVRDSAGRARLIVADVATGQSRRLADLPPRTQWIFTVPGGGYGVPDIETNSARVLARPGKPDTTWSAPNTPGRLLTVPGDMTSDGHALLEFSPARRGDTMWVRRVPLDGSVAAPAVPVLQDNWVGALSDGSYESILSDPVGGLGWYRVAPGANRSIRLGDAPVQGTGTTWTNSDDGRRFIVVKPVDRPDIYLIRNFGELLRH